MNENKLKKIVKEYVQDYAKETKIDPFWVTNRFSKDAVIQFILDEFTEQEKKLISVRNASSGKIGGYVTALNKANKKIEALEGAYETLEFKHKVENGHLEKAYESKIMYNKQPWYKKIITFKI